MSDNRIVLNGQLRTVKPGKDRQQVADELRAKGHDVQLPTVKTPAFGTLKKWALSEGFAKATDGCKVEPDGTCCHGHRSWLLVLNIL